MFHHKHNDYLRPPALPSLVAATALFTANV
jgi:hypothetical protein